MPTRRIHTVDAFSAEPLRGNPAAVVLDAEGLSAEQMQALAAEFNLSETVFLLPATVPEADYAVRIFTPRAELPFAGHPTLAAAFTVDQSGWLGRPVADALLRQECGIGVVPIEVREGTPRTYVMTQAQPAFRDTPLDAQAVAELIGCAPDEVAPYPVEVVSTGAPWCLAGLRSLDAMRCLAPRLPEIAEWSEKLGCEGITVVVDEAEDPSCRVRLRTFAPRHGIAEDPVCGSGNGAAAAYLARHSEDFAPPFEYLAEQGVEMGRGGFAWCAVDGEPDALRVRVGGAAARVVEGRFTL